MLNFTFDSSVLYRRSARARARLYYRSRYQDLGVLFLRVWLMCLENKIAMILINGKLLLIAMPSHTNGHSRLAEHARSFLLCPPNLIYNSIYIAKIHIHLYKNATSQDLSAIQENSNKPWAGSDYEYTWKSLIKKVKQKISNFIKVFKVLATVYNLMSYSRTTTFNITGKFASATFSAHSI